MGQLNTRVKCWHSMVISRYASFSSLMLIPTSCLSAGGTADENKIMSLKDLFVSPPERDLMADILDKDFKTTVLKMLKKTKEVEKSQENDT